MSTFRKATRNDGARIAAAIENGDYIIFPHFYMYRSDHYWHWVSTDATKSSLAGFESAQTCALDANRSLSVTA